MRDDKERLLDITEVINKLLSLVPKNKPLHELGELEFMGVIRYLEIIGEASRSLSESFKGKYNYIPWREIANMRNILIHQYFNVDVEKVEIAVKKEIPQLKNQIEKILHG